MAKRYGWNGVDGVEQPERLISALCMACMGAGDGQFCERHSNFGGDSPWIPTPEDLDINQLTGNFEMIDYHDHEPKHGVMIKPEYKEKLIVARAHRFYDPIKYFERQDTSYNRQMKDGLLRANGLRPGQPEEGEFYWSTGYGGYSGHIKCDDDRLNQILSGRAEPLQSDFTIQRSRMLERTGLRSTADFPLLSRGLLLLEL